MQFNSKHMSLSDYRLRNAHAAAPKHALNYERCLLQTSTLTRRSATPMGDSASPCTDAWHVQVQCFLLLAAPATFAQPLTVACECCSLNNTDQRRDIPADTRCHAY
jgi:hypothetical protein